MADGMPVRSTGELDMATYRKNQARAWAEGIRDSAPGPKGPDNITLQDLDRLRAQGISVSQISNIELSINRDDFGRILQFIEERAVKSESYLEVRQAVLFSEMLRSQARDQGY